MSPQAGCPPGTTTLDLPDNGGSTVAQNDMISQVAAANPHTIVVLDDNSAITMPWLNQVAGVFEAFYPGQQIGTAVAALLFGDVNPSGKLPVTFPKSLADVPAATPAQWPGTNGQVQYSEGLDVGYRWYDAKNIAPLFPFGFGLSYTTFGFGNLQVGALSGGTATVHVTVTNTGSRAGTDVAQLYVGDPASAGEPVHQLRGFQRVTLDPGQSQTLTFTVSTHDLASWNTSGHTWTTAADSYQVLVGDSSRNLPVSGTLSVPTTVNGALAAAVSGKAGAAPLALPSPYGMSSPARTRIDWTFDPKAKGVSYSAAGLPPGITLAPSGRFTGAATRTGTWTVTVTGRDASGARGSATFVWTVT